MSWISYHIGPPPNSASLRDSGWGMEWRCHRAAASVKTSEDRPGTDNKLEARRFPHQFSMQEQKRIK
jgi:hypothetical protein